MKKRIATFFFVFSLSGYSTLAFAGLALSALAVIGAAALGVTGVVLASPGLLTAAAFIGGAGLLCSATSFCDIDPVSNSPSPAAAPLSSASTAPIGPRDLSAPLSPSTYCALVYPGGVYNKFISTNVYGQLWQAHFCTVAGVEHNLFEGYASVDAKICHSSVTGMSALPETNGLCSPENSFAALPSDGVKIANSAAPTSPSLELPSVASLPPGAYEIWPGSGLYGAPGGTNVIYDMRDPNTGDVFGAAKTTLTENPDGSKVLEIDVVGSAEPGKLRIDILPDGSKLITATRPVSVTDSQGVPDKLKTAVVTEYSPAGDKLGTNTFASSTSDNAGPAPYSVDLSEGGDGSPITTSPATDPAPGTGTGSCTSGDCSTESTQLANKGLLQTISGLLQGIKDFFTGTATEPGVPTARTANEIKAGSLDGTGAFTGLKGWQLPVHASQCPTSSFAWNGNTYTFDAHCQLATDHFAAFRGVMTLVFSLSALFVVLKA